MTLFSSIFPGVEIFLVDETFYAVKHLKKNRYRIEFFNSVYEYIKIESNGSSHKDALEHYFYKNFAKGEES